MDIAAIRKDYAQKTLDVSDVHSDPHVQFQNWLKEAIDASALEPTAMILATVHQQMPTTRVVLLKGIEEGGFVFFTNYSSEKGRELAANPYAALNFFWPELERQVRIEGIVKKASAELSNSYFKSRPTNSRVGAWASPQSSEIPDRKWLEDREASFKQQYDQNEIPRPDFWGGYVLEATEIEFWQGRPSRLHDRIKYIKTEPNNWKITRLAP
ncbi:MAG: pyridoxamine 5'-phosphate oxidase [Cytophagales bacterium]